ncbi:protein of unknown function [Methylorubrum extorquens]|uniref:Uncharacterized protein n=1 Tax=Methylorubrum extorquens TaxID=408 RepID=A0A2N9AN33_METEX|nr:protein of unknown function [Methylorubrum extorquens]
MSLIVYNQTILDAERSAFGASIRMLNR